MSNSYNDYNLMQMRAGKRKRRTPKTPPEIRPDTILNPSILTFHERNAETTASVDKDGKLPFLALMQAINRRAEALARQDANYPLMDMSALYCFGTAIKEYVSYLSKKQSTTSHDDKDIGIDTNERELSEDELEDVDQNDPVDAEVNVIDNDTQEPILSLSTPAIDTDIEDDDGSENGSETDYNMIISVNPVDTQSQQYSQQSYNIFTDEEEDYIKAPYHKAKKRRISVALDENTKILDTDSE